LGQQVVWQAANVSGGFFGSTIRAVDIRGRPGLGWRHRQRRHAGAQRFARHATPLFEIMLFQTNTVNGKTRAWFRAVAARARGGARCHQIEDFF
jgi:hypothetical protein